jgi:predicted N-acyltransferase
MVGCAAGEGHLDGDATTHAATAQALAAALPGIARNLGASLIVLKEFPAQYRPALQCFCERGFARVPSMPMTRLSLPYKDFEDYVAKALSPRTRGKLRRKLRDSDRAEPPIEVTVVDDATPFAAEIHRLYLNVYERSSLKFEKLTKEFFGAVGQRMPDKVRFFLWRAGNTLIAFNLCLLHGDLVFSEYIGFDYEVAYDVNLYYRVFRDIVVWAMANGYKRFGSSSLNYDPKWHLRQELDPIDLYVHHTSPLVNAVLKRALPFMEPTRYDKILPNFPNYRELWG